jgi:hypothetical protein
MCSVQHDKFEAKYQLSVTVLMSVQLRCWLLQVCR